MTHLNLSRCADLALAGALTTLPFGVWASAADAQSDNPAVFVVNEVSDSVASFTVNTDGTLTLVGTAPTTDGPRSIGLTPSGRFLALGHPYDVDGTITTDFLRIFRVNADASLTLILTKIIPATPLDLHWLSDTTLATTQTAFGGVNEVNVWRFDEAANSLTLIDFEPTGLFNTHIAMSPDGGLLFAQDSLSNMIRTFTVNDDGTLDFASIISTASLFALEMIVTHDGSTLYAADGISGDGHRVLGMAVDEAANTLTPLPGSPFFSPGNSPAHVVVSSDDSLLIVGHGTDSTVRPFTINADGSISPTGFFFDVGLQGTIGDLKVLGDLLFVTDNSTALDNITGVYSFTINPDGTLTQNGLFNTQGIGPKTIAVWPGAAAAPGDLNGDGVVDGQDLAALLAQWGTDGSADLNGDGVVNGADLATLLASWTV